MKIHLNSWAWYDGNGQVDGAARPAEEETRRKLSVLVGLKNMTGVSSMNPRLPLLFPFDLATVK